MHIICFWNTELQKVKILRARREVSIHWVLFRFVRKIRRGTEATETLLTVLQLAHCRKGHALQSKHANGKIAFGIFFSTPPHDHVQDPQEIDYQRQSACGGVNGRGCGGQAAEGGRKSHGGGHEVCFHHVSLAEVGVHRLCWVGPFQAQSEHCVLVQKCAFVRQGAWCWGTARSDGWPRSIFPINIFKIGRERPQAGAQLVSRLNVQDEHHAFARWLGANLCFSEARRVCWWERRTAEVTKKIPHQYHVRLLDSYHIWRRSSVIRENDARSCCRKDSVVAWTTQKIHSHQMFTENHQLIKILSDWCVGVFGWCVWCICYGSWQEPAAAREKVQFWSTWHWKPNGGKCIRTRKKSVGCARIQKLSVTSWEKRGGWHPQRQPSWMWKVCTMHDGRLFTVPDECAVLHNCCKSRITNEETHCLSACLRPSTQFARSEKKSNDRLRFAPAPHVVAPVHSIISCSSWNLYPHTGLGWKFVSDQTNLALSVSTSNCTIPSLRIANKSFYGQEVRSITVTETSWTCRDPAALLSRGSCVTLVCSMIRVPTVFLFLAFSIVSDVILFLSALFQQSKSSMYVFVHLCAPQRIHPNHLESTVVHQVVCSITSSYLMWTSCRMSTRNVRHASLHSCEKLEFRRSAFLPWVNGCVDNKSAVGEVDECNTRDVGERELVLVFTWMSEGFWHTLRLELVKPLEPCTHVICAVLSVEWLHIWKSGVRQVYLSTHPSIASEFTFWQAKKHLWTEKSLLFNPGWGSPRSSTFPPIVVLFPLSWRGRKCWMPQVSLWLRRVRLPSCSTW